MGVSGVCVRMLRRGWLCLKVVLTVYTKRSPKESASLVDPVQMCCVYQRLVLSTRACLLRVRIVPLCCQYVRWHEFFTPRNKLLSVVSNYVYSLSHKYKCKFVCFYLKWQNFSILTKCSCHSKSEACVGACLIWFSNCSSLCVCVHMRGCAFSSGEKRKCYLDCCFVLPLNNTLFWGLDPPCTLGWSHINTFFLLHVLTANYISLIYFHFVSKGCNNTMW